MKKRIAGLLLCLLVPFLAGCPDYSVGKKQEPKPNPGNNKTLVRFSNANDFSVDVYSDYARQTKIATVSAQGQSDSKEVTPNNNGDSFFPTYQILIDSVSIPYEGEVIIVGLNKGKTNTVPIPLLRDFGEAELNKPLSNDVYLKIQNDSDSSLSLSRGSSEISPVGSNSAILNSRTTGLYRISSGLVSNYSLRRNTTYPVAFPEGLTEFVSGYFYSLRYEGGSLILVAEKPLTLTEALGVYTVSFNSNGGSDVPSQTVKKGEEGRATRPDNPTRTGYYFGGWCRDPGFSMDNYDFGELVTGSFTLYARWSPISYLVAYDPNGGIGTIGYSEHDYDRPDNLQRNTFTHSRTSFTFAGLAESPDGPVVYTDGQSVINLTSVGSDPRIVITLYAVWAGHPYTVTYNANSGDGSMEDSNFVYGIQQDLRLNTFTRAGYGFVGWATSPTGTAVYTDGESVRYLTEGPTITLYAVWAHTYTVVYDAGSGSGFMEDSVLTYSISQNLRINNFTNPGYGFIGWARFPGGTVVAFTDGQAVLNLAGEGETITLYAVWALTYTVIYDANGGNGYMENSNFAYGVEQNLRVNAFTRTGYNFKGWATSPSGTVSYWGTILYTEGSNTVTLYAVWEGISYIVAYNANGGSGTMLPSNFTYGVEQNLRENTFTRIGYAFAGWATSTTGTPVYTDEQAVINLRSTSGDFILYAVWSYNFYTVAYSANGGSGTMASSTFITGQSQNLRPNTFTRTSYTFAGWATTPAGAPVYTDRQSVSNLVTAGATITLYAVWAGVSYTVAYNANGGGGSMDPSGFTYGVAQNLRENTFTKTGHVFIGWGTAQNAITPVYTDRQSVSNLSGTAGATVTLYAVWSNQLTVYYNANSGNGSMESSAFTFGVEQNLRTNSFTRTGYTFAGWATSSTGSAVYTNGLSVSFSPSVGVTTTLYAVWIINTYTVVYDSNNGSGNMDPSGFTYGVSQNLQENTFTRAGYAFSGWATSPAGGVAYNDRQSVSNLTAQPNYTVTLYAVWIYTYRVVYNANGGTGYMEPTSFTGSESKNLSANTFTRANHVFTGWAQTANGPVIFNDRQNVGNLTTNAGTDFNLHAVWVHTYTVSYNANGGSGTMSPSNFTYGVEQNLRENTFTNTGHTFTGWATSPNGTRAYTNGQPVNNLTTIPGDPVQLYAVWVANTYTVSYNANNGGGDMSPTNFTYGVWQSLRPNAFARTGYIFSGWATSQAGSVVYNNEQSVSNLTATPNGSVTLYAVWTPITYTVVYNPNGGEGYMDPSPFTYDASQFLRGIAFSRTNYSFRGWALTENGAVAYTNGQSVNNLTTNAGATVTLYAVWAPVYTVIFGINGGTGGSMPGTTFIYGVPQNLPLNAYTRPGYVFLGWALTSTGLVAYTDGQSVSDLSDVPGAMVTLYARWGTRVTTTENFESGGTDWTLVNGTQTNKWYVGTGTANGGTRSCYISNNSSANSYTLTTTSTVHFYRDFANIESISFDIKVQGQAGYDYVNVYLVDTTVTPVAGTLLSNPLATYSMLGTTWQQRTINIPSTTTGTKRLVFTWVNNNSTGTQPPAAIDNISVVTTSIQ
jgi:uncharacterized repeat protein (TIGR02543 family)